MHLALHERSHKHTESHTQSHSHTPHPQAHRNERTDGIIHPYGSQGRPPTTTSTVALTHSPTHPVERCSLSQQHALSPTSTVEFAPLKVRCPLRSTTAGGGAHHPLEATHLLVPARHQRARPDTAHQASLLPPMRMRGRSQHTPSSCTTTCVHVLCILARMDEGVGPPPSPSPTHTLRHVLGKQLAGPVGLQYPHTCACTHPEPPDTTSTKRRG